MVTKDLQTLNLILHSHQKLSCLKSGVEFDMNDILYEFKNLHHFQDSLTFGVKAVLNSTKSCLIASFSRGKEILK